MLILPCYPKYDALYEIFCDRGYFDSWPSKKITPMRFLEVISKTEYNLKEDLGVAAATIAHISKKAFPDKPRTSGKICGFLLGSVGYQQCAKCEMVLQKTKFHNNSSKATGKQSYCILCFNDNVRDYRRFYRALYKASKLKRTPSWSDLSVIRSFYENCPEGYHVDHIIPLHGDSVSGLHVIENLQYLLAEDNLKKSNKYMPG